MDPILFIVVLPLLAALIAGLGNRMIGNVPAKLVTTAGLFASCALSWPVFLGFLGADRFYLGHGLVLSMWCRCCTGCSRAA